MRFTIYDLQPALSSPKGFTIRRQLSRFTFHVSLFTAYCLLFTLLLTLLFISTGYWRATGTGPQVQVPMFYDAHYLFPRPWTQEQEAPGVPDPFPVSAVFGPNEMRQSFIVGADNLSMVEVWLAGPNGVTVEVFLSGEGFAGRGQVVLSKGPTGNWYRFTFPPIKNSRNHAYELALVAPTATLEQPVTTYVVGGDRLGEAVKLNEYGRPGNLVLHTYSRGWPGRWWFSAVAEQLLPGVFRLRLQQYKPALFKGSTFSLLLGATVVLTFVFLVLSHSSLHVSRFTFHVFRFTLPCGLIGVLGAFIVWQLGTGRLQFPLGAISLQPADSLLPLNLTGGELRVTNDLVGTLWTAERLPEPRFIQTAWAEWSLIQVPGESMLNYAVTLPLNGRFRAGMMTEGEGELRFVVRFGDQELASRTLSPSDSITWLEVDLTGLGGQAGTLSLMIEPVDGEPNGQWIQPQILTKSEWLLPDPLPADLVVQSVAYRFAETAELTGYTTDYHDGLLDVTLYWRLLQETAESAIIFIHLLDESGQIVAQQDIAPVSGTYPLSIWQHGVIIMDKHTWTVPLNSGRYTLVVGLYDPDTLTRWTATDANGEILPDGRVELGRLEIED